MVDDLFGEYEYLFILELFNNNRKNRSLSSAPRTLFFLTEQYMYSDIGGISPLNMKTEVSFIHRDLCGTIEYPQLILVKIT